MKRPEFNRRDFNKMTIAAFGGIVAGTAIGCGETADDPPEKKPSETDASHDDEHSHGDGGGEVSGNDFSGPVHVCRGLNSCKNQGASGSENACAGQGACATAPEISCGGENDCKNQGGCGDTAGQNTCKGTGGCHVPLTMEDSWKKARTAFETAMKKAGKDFGDAPPAKEG